MLKKSLIWARQGQLFISTGKNLIFGEEILRIAFAQLHYRHCIHTKLYELARASCNFSPLCKERRRGSRQLFSHIDCCYNCRWTFIGQFRKFIAQQLYHRINLTCKCFPSITRAKWLFRWFPLRVNHIALRLRHKITQKGEKIYREPDPARQKSDKVLATKFRLE